MTEEQKGQLQMEEAPEQEPVAPEMEGSTSVEEPAERRKTGWTVAVIAAILALCTIVVCIASAIAALSGGKDEVSAPAPTVAPTPTRAPGQAMIAITEPDQGQVVGIGSPQPS